MHMNVLCGKHGEGQFRGSSEWAEGRNPQVPQVVGVKVKLRFFK